MTIETHISCIERIGHYNIKMEIRIVVSEFSRALQLLQGVILKKHMMPILANVFLKAENNELCLRATDLEINIQIKLTCEIINPGIAAVSARSLLDIARSLPGPHATLSTSDKNLFIKSIKTEARLLILPAEDFPNFPNIVDVEFNPISTDVFTEIIQKTLYATSIDENRYNLTGVYADPEKETDAVVFVSTDGHRLSKIQIPFIKQIFNNRSVIFPKKGLIELNKILSDFCSDNDFVELGFLNNQVVFKTNKSILIMRFIEGKFPDYNQVIPKITDKIMRATRIDFISSLKRVAVLANDKSQSVKLTLKNGELIVSCSNLDMGEICDQIPIEYSGSDMEIFFNINYLIEAINSLSDSNIIMRFTDSYSPTIITGLQEKKHLCVLMPVRI